MSKDKTRILDNEQIDQKIKRIAHQILESNYKEKEIFIVGIKGGGMTVAERIASFLQSESNIAIQVCTLTLNKEKPLSEPIEFDADAKSLKNKTIVVVDDVLNSGRTLIYAVKYLLDFSPKKVCTATLIDRIHRKFPIRADFVGMSLSTNLKEHIKVQLGPKRSAAYLEA